MATFQKTHPWITFNINLDRLDYEIWIKMGQVRAICEYVSGIPLNPDVQAHLHSVYLAKGVHATTAIEGNTLSEAQVQDRINGKLKLPASQEYLGIEVDNVLLGCNKIKQAVMNGETWRLSFDEIYGCSQPRAMPWADIIRPFGAKRAKYIGVFFVGNHLTYRPMRDILLTRHPFIANVASNINKYGIFSMDENYLKSLIEKIQNGRIGADAAMDILKRLPFEDIGFARIDHHRCIRNGAPEVIYCEGKTLTQIQGIVQKLAEHHRNILATRAGLPVYEAIQAISLPCKYHEMARIVVIHPDPIEKTGRIVVVSAGTSDMSVAEEAAVTAETLGNQVSRLYDVGVAGIHRLLAVWEDLSQANVAVVVAGMEGALASVVGGMVSCPVIGVPTSIGYGTSFGGIAALLSMLNSCASGVSVVNIDNGFGAGYQASIINHLASKIPAGR